MFLMSIFLKTINFRQYQVLSLSLHQIELISNMTNMIKSMDINNHSRNILLKTASFFYTLQSSYEDLCSDPPNLIKHIIIE